MTRITEAEQIAGKRADFLVYYRRKGKLFYDAMWADTAEEAERQMLGSAKELRWQIEIVRVEPIKADA